VAWTEREIATLDPGCFALVMATGIISNAFFLEGRRGLSDVLFAVNLAAYSWLCVATALRAVRFTAEPWADLASPRLVFSFVTIVAATDVLAMGIDLRGFGTVALAMWLVALAVWLILIYAGFAVLMFLNKAGGAKVIDGGWLNAIVGTQSLVILGAQITALPASAGPTVPVLIHMLWTVGLGLYGILVVLLSYRMFFVELKPDDVNPQLWVVMGAAAIKHECRIDAGREQWRTAFLAVDQALHRWRYPRHVGLGDVVDSAFALARRVEARRAPRAAALHDDAMEHGIPAWHVCGGEPATVPGRGSPGAAIDVTSHGLDRACRLERNWYRPFVGIVAQRESLHRSGTAVRKHECRFGAVIAGDIAASRTRKHRAGLRSGRPRQKRHAGGVVTDIGRRAAR
jgi:Voltage-dependent anion channel